MIKKLFIISTIFLLIFSTYCGERRANISGRSYTLFYDIAKKCFMQISRNNKSIFMKNKYSQVSTSVDSKYLTLNGTKILLSFPIKLYGNSSYLSTNDWVYTIEPLLNRRVLTPQKISVIVIDPGHGGSDTGAIGKISKEKDLSLKIGSKLSSMLKKYGYRVYQTRYTDKTMSLQERVNFAKAKGADLFISIHANAATASVYGIETYSLTPVGAPSSNGGSISSTVYPGHRYVKNNTLLCYTIQRWLRMKTYSVDRAVKRARFLVLREINCPAVLVETGFISNLNEERKLNSVAYQNKIAQALLNGIIQYHRALPK